MWIDLFILIYLFLVFGCEWGCWDPFHECNRFLLLLLKFESEFESFFFFLYLEIEMICVCVCVCVCSTLYWVSIVAVNC